jgi:hypothetical protein
VAFCLFSSPTCARTVSVPMGVRCLVGSPTPSDLSRAVRYFFGFSRPSGPAPTPNPAGDGGTVSPPDEVPATSGGNSCPPTPDSDGADTNPPRNSASSHEARLAGTTCASRRHRKRLPPAPRAPAASTGIPSERLRMRRGTRTPIIRARVAPRAELAFAESERNLVERGRPRAESPSAARTRSNINRREPRPESASRTKRSDCGSGRRPQASRQRLPCQR